MFRKIMSHVVLVLSFMVLTFFVIQRLNEMMGFMTSTLSQYVIGLLAVCGIALAVADIADNLRREKKRFEHRQERTRR